MLRLTHRIASCCSVPSLAGKTKRPVGHRALVPARWGAANWCRHPRATARLMASDVSSPSGLSGSGSKPRPVKKQSQGKRGSGPGAKEVIFIGLTAGGVAYFVSSDAKDSIDNGLAYIGEKFEDFNETSYEFLQNMGDRLISQKKEPWLLEHSVMKYPENIPTLVLDLDKVILHLEHDSRNGWHVIKRPFVDQFFKEISHYYEVVIFSDDVFPVALDIAQKMNLPVTGVLHRDFCLKRRGHYIKDISKLGRKLERVLILDHDPQAFALQPENGVLIRPFEGDPNDGELMDFIEFLKAAAISGTDIRKFVEKFEGGDVDIGRRFLLHKQGQDERVASRRSFGRAFAPGRIGSNTSPVGGLGGGMSLPR